MVLALGLSLIWAVGCGQDVETRTSPIDGKTMVRVPAGQFTMGTSPDQERALAEKAGTPVGTLGTEMPTHQVNVGEFWLDREPVTNAEYKKFLESNAAHPVPETELALLKQWGWDAGTRSFPAGRENYPVVLVSWNDAEAYCRWAGKRLPTEAEWEKAARGTDGRLYPWGNEWDDSRTAYGKSGAVDAAPVDSFPGGASPYGAKQMVGNIWQWTSTLWMPYPYQADDGREDLQQAGSRVTRGGMFAFGPAVSRTTVRSALEVDNRAISVGFRCALN
jgi:formylglycine-generating enzyme required for sulfatase activity